MAVRARRSGSRSFAAFVQMAWSYVMQVDPLVWGWHMDAMCDHFEEVARGRIRRLLVNVPPGHAKSVLLSVLWPAWIWTWWPKCQFLFGSYGHDIAQRDSVRCRAVIESEWYRETFSRPAGWTLRHDQNAKDWFVNTEGGERYATGIGGLGRRAHIIGIDDPLNAEERHSKAARERVNDWIGTTLSQRLVDPVTGRVAMIMQRLHEEDPSGFVLSAPGWEHLMLPAEFDPERCAVTHHEVEKRNGHVEIVRQEFWRDPRTERGELLFPVKFPREVLERFKLPNSLGAQGFATLQQQNPHPEEGGLFKLLDWRFWKPDLAQRQRYDYQDHSVRPRGCVPADEFPAQALNLDDLDDLIISVDGAGGSETKGGSFNTIHVWASKGSRRCLVYRVHRRMDFTDTVDELLRVIDLFPDARRKLIEAKASGSSIISTLEKKHGVTGLEPVNPGKQSKIERAHAMQPYHTGHNVELPEGAPWLEEYIGEHAAFPNGAHDDDVDAQSQGLQGLERGKNAWEEWGDEPEF